MLTVGAGCCVFLLVLMGTVLWNSSPWFLLALVPVLVLCLLATMSTLATEKLSPQGEDYAGRIHDVLVGMLAPRSDWRILDVGSGDRDLARRLSREPGTRVVRVDIRRRRGRHWSWSRPPFSRRAAVPNTRGELGTRDASEDQQVLRASCARLPFEDGSFDAVVSCWALHDGHQPEEIGQYLAEMLRVLRDGGRFALLDLFADTRRYPSIPWLEDTIKDAGGRISRRERLRERIALPFCLRNRFVLGRAGLIVGEKDTLSRP